jgi:hypothetical protein
LTLDGAVALGDEIAERAPAWRAAAEEAIGQLGPDTRTVVTATGDDGSPSALALQLIFVEGANDFWDTLHDAAMGRGRPALRATRTLFELQLDALDVAGSPALAERWRDHLPVADVAEGRLTRVERHLSGDIQRAVRRRMRHLRKRGARELATAQSRWGKGFGARWHPQTLRDRADAHSLLADYEGLYRFASVPSHGSRAGMRGLERTIQKAVVVRSGPAVTLAPYAVLYATEAMRVIARTTANLVDLDISRLLGASDHLDAVWPEFYEAMIRLDDELWPTEPPPRAGALFVVQPEGDGHWYEYASDTYVARAARTHEADLFDEQGDPFHAFVDKVLLVHQGPRRVGIVLEEARVRAPGAGPWLPVRDLLDLAPITITPSGHVRVPASFLDPAAQETVT